MHKHISSSIAIAIIITLTVIVIGLSYAKSPELRSQLAHALETTANQIKGAFVPGKDDHYAEITNDDGSKEQVLILEPEGGVTDESADDTVAEFGIPSSTDIILPTELEGFKPSPESAWAQLYLQMLQIRQDDLDIEIGYAREWQQTGGLFRDIGPGAKGPDVRLVQYLISKLAPHYGITFDRSSITGTYGPKTKAAIVALQKRLSISPNGELSNETRFFLDSLYFKDLCPDADVMQDKSYENVNRRISVPKDYIPSDLIRLPRTIRTVGIMCLSREPARRLEEMFNAAAREGQDLAVISAYRSARTQELLTAFYRQTEGASGLAGIAESGHSEHQLGTTIDLSGRAHGYSGPQDGFGKTPEGQWLFSNSYKFGFIMSYPEGKQQDTGYKYEPWHFRYVGVDIAKDIFEEKMTIQEYLHLVNSDEY